MPSFSLWILSLMIGLSTFFSACQSNFQKQANSEPDFVCPKTAFWENSYARTWSSALHPQQKTEFHVLNTPCIIFTDKDTILIKESPSGERRLQVFRAYQPVWIDRGDEGLRLQNPLDESISFMVIEFKEGILHRPDSSVQQVPPKNLIWENEEIWTSVYQLPAQTSTALASGRPIRILIANDNYQVIKTDPEGNQSILNFPAHIPIWFHQDNTCYQTTNQTKEPMNFIVVQFKPGVLP